MRNSTDGADEEVSKVAKSPRISREKLDVELQRGSNMSVNVAKRDQNSKEQESSHN